MKLSLRFTPLLLLAALFDAPMVSRADMALLVEDPAGYKGFVSDSGHLAIWMQDACVGKKGRVSPCADRDGVVLSSTSAWTKRGWAAIPAPLYFEGAPGTDERSAWSEWLGDTYPSVSAEFGRTYINHLQHRGAYILHIRTSPAEDARVLEQIQAGRENFKYAYFSNNCSDFARDVLNLYFPGHFRRRLLPDFDMTTPRAVANRFWKYGQQTPELWMHVYYLPRRSSEGRFHHGPTKGICEAATTDPKYAVPLLLFEPMAYGAFGACYLLAGSPNFMHYGFRKHAERIASFTQAQPKVDVDVRFDSGLFALGENDLGSMNENSPGSSFIDMKQSFLQ